MNFGGFYNPVNYPNPMPYQQSCNVGSFYGGFFNNNCCGSNCGCGC